jgi:Mor family transcriptional regulator
MGYDLKTLHRLWSKVIIPINYENDCWIWTASTNKDGYGNFSIKGKNYIAHRITYQCYNGPILDNNLLIRHSCDVPGCVSPYHLKTGTQYDNIHDAINRGRFAYGENNGRAILTENDVKDILNYLWEGNNNVNCIELGKKYNVDSITINLISKGKTWKNIYNQLTKDQKERIKFNVKNKLSSGSLTINDVKEIRELYKTTKIKQIDLAKKFNVTRSAIYRIIARKTWKHI